MNLLFYILLLINIFNVNSFLLPLTYHKHSIRRINYFNKPFMTDYYLHDLHFINNYKKIKNKKYNINYNTIDKLNYIYYYIVYLYILLNYNTLFNNPTLLYYDDYNIIYYDI